MIEFVIAGVLLGTVCGLLPGLHPNTTIPFILAFSLYFDPLSAAVILISAGVANTFVSFVPSIFLGAPDPEEALSVLPGHRLLFEGRGYEAVRLTVIGGLVTLSLGLVFLPLFFFGIPHLYGFVRPVLHVVLFGIIFYMILRDRSYFWSFAVVLLSASLGIIVLNNLGSTMLFPMLTGLFGVPVLVYSIMKPGKKPVHSGLEFEKISAGRAVKSSFVGLLSGVSAGILPGVGVTQATVIAQQFFGSKNTRDFLIAIGGVNTADIIFSVIAIYLIGNPRSGIASAISGLISPGLGELAVLISAAIISASVAAIITLYVAKRFTTLVFSVNYKTLSLLVLGFVTFLVIFFTGLQGLGVLVVSSLIGLIPVLSGVNRSHAMACLIVPAALYFWGVGI
ncbi:MAG: hypothetical protein GXO63_02945 [Candidatus Micrarchaeota archaeon]|nr:hypothetical protein [Candidatus Micrarchaeota archaeon]